MNRWRHRLTTARIFHSPYWPAFLSGFIAPGLGQIFNKELFKGLLLLFSSFGGLMWFSQVLTEQLSLILPGPPERWPENQAAMREAIVVLYKENPGLFITFQLLVVTVWIYGMVDAFLTAKKSRRRIPNPADADIER